MTEGLPIAEPLIASDGLDATADRTQAPRVRLETRKGNGRPLEQWVFEQLETAIVKRDLPPGTHLREDEIATQLGVSRTPVREAFRMLERAHWLDIQPNVGAKVRHPTLAEIRDLFELREALDRQAAELACERATDEEIAELAQVAEQGEREVEFAGPDQIATLNKSFHGIIANASRNELLIRTLSELQKQVRWHIAAVTPPRKDSWHEHRLIVDAITRRDKSEAGQLIAEHTRRTFEDYLASLLKHR